MPPELHAAIEQRVRSGLYGDSSDVIRAGLRALFREEISKRFIQFQQILARLPNDPIPPQVEEKIVRAVLKSRQRIKQRG